MAFLKKFIFTQEKDLDQIRTLKSHKVDLEETKPQMKEVRVHKEGTS